MIWRLVEGEESDLVKDQVSDGSKFWLLLAEDGGRGLVE